MKGGARERAAAERLAVEGLWCHGATLVASTSTQPFIWKAYHNTNHAREAIKRIRRDRSVKAGLWTAGMPSHVPADLVTRSGVAL